MLGIGPCGLELALAFHHSAAADMIARGLGLGRDPVLDRALSAALRQKRTVAVDHLAGESKLAGARSAAELGRFVAGNFGSLLPGSRRDDLPETWLTGGGACCCKRFKAKPAGDCPPKARGAQSYSFRIEAVLCAGSFVRQRYPAVCKELIESAEDDLSEVGDLHVIYPDRDQAQSVSAGFRPRPAFVPGKV